MRIRSIDLRQSPKRIYVRGGTYFVTSTTHERYPYFSTSNFSELLIEDLWFASELKEVELLGYTVMPEHFHFLFKPLGKSNYGQVTGSLKRNVSRDINDLLSGSPVVRILISSGIGADSKPPHPNHRHPPLPMAEILPRSPHS